MSVEPESESTEGSPSNVSLQDVVEEMQALREENEALRERVEAAEQRAIDAEERAKKAERMAAANTTHLRGLLERVENLTELMVTKTSLNHLIDRLVPGLEVDDYTRSPMRSVASVEQFGAELTRVIDAVEENPENPNQDPMTQNWIDCVEHAQKLQHDPNHARQDGYTALYVQDVANATGHSRRHCNDLVEDLGDDHEGATWQSHKENNKENGSDRRKALLINLDIWGTEDE